MYIKTEPNRCYKLRNISYICNIYCINIKFYLIKLPDQLYDNTVVHFTIVFENKN